MSMSEVELGSAQYTGGTGEYSGGDIGAAAAQLRPGDVAKMRLTFPVPIAGFPAGALAAILGPIFGAFGQQLEGVDYEGDSTLVLVWVVG